MVAWHDAVTNTLNIQVNDGAAATVAYSSGAMDTTYPLTIGAHADGAGAWDGRIDEVFLYKRVLRTDERTWLYNGGRGRSYIEVQPVPSSSASLLTYAASVTGCMGGGRTIAHAVSAMGSSNTYTYDCNGNQTRHISGSDTYDLVYDAENRLSQVKKNNIVIATFTYDGDSNRVKSVLGTETTLFVGGHYEVTNPGAGQTVTKYYFAGSTRVAMRKYTIPQSMTVEYFLGDHLGSTSISTDSAGAKVSEIRYQPWGEIRYAWKSGTVTTPAYKLASYTFTGQYSYMDDPTTTGVTEGFGLMYYNARYYSPCIMQFNQPDTLIPELYNPQSLNRYSYVNNNPIRYTDPTGHMRVADQDMSRNNAGLNCSKYPQYCTNRKPKLAEELAKMRHKNNGEEQSISDKILANKYTPIGAAAVQVLSGTVMLVATPFVETPTGLGVWVGAFAVNRGSSLLGLASTFYQYDKNLYGTNFTDVVVNGTAFALGWIPSLTEGLSIGVLVYSGIRLEHEAPINIPAPDFLK